MTRRRLLSPRGQRPQTVLVLSLIALSALAAGRAPSLARGAGASAEPATAGETPRRAGAASPRAVPKAVAVGGLASAWTSVANKGLSLKSGIGSTPTPPAQPLRIAVSVKLRDTAGLKAFIDDSHTPGDKRYGQVLSTQQFNDAYAPTAAQAQAVSDYLARMGFRDIAVASNRAVITASGTAGIAEAAFNTHLVNFTWQGKATYANTTDVQVPNTLADAVLSVAGLNNIVLMRLHSHVAPGTYQDVFAPRAQAAGGQVVAPATGPAATHANGYTGPQYEVAYDANSVAPAYATTVGIVSAGTDLSSVTAQLLLAERVNKQPVVPVTIKQVMPVPTTQVTGNDGEWDLDSQAASGIGENLNQIVFYNTTDLGDTNLIPAVNKFAADNVAQVGNQSYGGCEIEQSTLGNIGGFEQAFMQAVAQGQTWFASTGDTGSGCGSPVNTGYPTGVPDPEYPASSPNIVAAGGTTLSTDANFAYVTEAAWIGGGAGTSEIFAPPKWQVAAGVSATGTAGGTAGGLPTGGSNGTGVPASEAGVGRATADLAMAADPASGLTTFVGGARETIGGTSLSSPLSAGSYARMQTAHCNTLGFGAPRFYALDTKPGLMSTATGFHDVTTGSANGAYVTTTGWDNPTGFGSFDIAAVNKALPKAANCVLNQKPIAKLAADQTIANAPARVTFSGSSSSDPDGDKIVQYILDFGDNSDVAIQSGAVFPPHQYALPGNYIATLSVRDAVGNASLPVTQPVTIYGVPQGCTLPGQQLVTSPPGVSFGTQGMDIASGQDDLRATYFAEPGDGTNNLVVTMKVANLKGGPMAAFRWVTYFNIPEDTNNYYVSMDTSASTPAYTYGIHTYTAAGGVTTYTQLGTLDAKSTNTPDGTITLILNKSLLKLKTGDALSSITTSIRTSVPNATSTAPAGSGLTQESGSATQNYVLVGNDVCKADLASPPTAPVTTGGSTPAPTGNGGGSGSGTPPPTSGGSGTPPPTSGGSGTPPPTSGGTTPPPTSGTGGASNAGASFIPSVVAAPARNENYGRGGAGALGWLVLGPLAAGTLRRRRVRRRPAG